MPKIADSQIVTSIASTDSIIVIKDGITSEITPANLAGSLSIELQGDLKIRSSDAAVAGVSGDGVILMDTSGGNLSVTLPNPTDFYDSTNGVTKVLHIVQKISGGNTLTINQYASENIYVNGAADTSIAITGGSSATLVSDGTDWSVIG